MAAKKGADPKAKLTVSTLEPVDLQKLPAWAWIVARDWNHFHRLSHIPA